MKAVVLTAYVPDAWAVQIGSREVQISSAGRQGRGQQDRQREAGRSFQSTGSEENICFKPEGG